MLYLPTNSCVDGGIFNKWGKEVRDAIFDYWNINQKEDDSVVHFLVYAFDLIQVNDVGRIDLNIKKIMDNNPQMVEKARKNIKMVGWFVGQVFKIEDNANFNPEIVMQRCNFFIGADI